jgi:hypothetical protein
VIGSRLRRCLFSLGLVAALASCSRAEPVAEPTEQTKPDLSTAVATTDYLKEFLEATAANAGLTGGGPVEEFPDSCLGVGGHASAIEFSFGPMEENVALETLARVEDYWRSLDLTITDGPFRGQVLTETYGKNAVADWNVDGHGLVKIAASTGCFRE